MSTRILLPCALLVPQLALARNAGWFLKGATVEIPTAQELPLYRGNVGEHRPLIDVVLPDAKRDRHLLAVVDLGESWTRLGRDIAYDLGIYPEQSSISGEWTQVSVIPELRVGDLVLRDVRVEVVDGDDLVLGLGAFPQLATAILPSSGTVKIVPASEGRALVESVGEARPLYRQTRGTWKDRGEKRRGNGMSMSLDGSISGRDGRVMIRTGATTTKVGAAYSSSNTRRWQGVVHHRGRGRIGDDELAESWVEQDESLSDPAPDFVGAFGYDQLHVMDIAMSPADGIVATALVDEPTYTPTVERSLELAIETFEAGGLKRNTKRSDRPPRLQLGDADDPAAAEGDKGDSRAAELESALADALWSAGKLDEALPHFLRASEAAGDHCGPLMELGEKRLAWSGRMQEQKFITELIQQPLEEAGTLWDRWAGLSPDLREKIRKGEAVPAGTFQVSQNRRCLTAWGTLMAAYVRQGDTAASSAIYSAHYKSDPAVAFAQAISLLSQGQAATAEIPIRQALAVPSDETANFTLGLGRALAEQGKREAVQAIVDEIPDLQLDHPLTAAVMAVHWGYELDGEEGAADMARRLVKADPYWIPGQIVALWLGIEEADVAQLGAEIIRQRGRYAGDVTIESHAAVYRAVVGDAAQARKTLRTLQKTRPPHPDLFVGLALVASLRGNGERLEDALAELRLRFPMVPVDDLGLSVETPVVEE